MTRRGMLGALALAWALLVAGPASAEVPLPWQVGDEVGAGWTVRSIDRHAEFVRLGLTHAEDGRRVAVEITAGERPDHVTGGGCTVQPAPQTEEPPPQPLLEAFAADLRARGPDAEPLFPEPGPKAAPPADAAQADPAEAEEAPAAPRVADGSTFPAHQALLLLVVLWTALVLATRTRYGPWPVAVAGLLVAAAGAGGAWLFELAPPLSDWVLTLYEGNTTRNVQQLYGDAVTAGALFHSTIEALTGDPTLTLAHVVRVNVALWLVNAALFGVIARHVIGSRLGGALAAVAFALCPTSLATAASEMPTQLWTLVFLLGVVGFGALRALPGEPRERVGVGPLLLILLASAAAARIRFELAVVAAPAVLVAACEWSFGRARVEGWALTAAARLRALLAWALARPLVLALCAVALLASVAFDPLAEGRFFPLDILVAAVSPVNPWFWYLPGVILDLLPVGVALLALIGLVFGLGRLRVLAFVPLGVLMLFRVYGRSAHGFQIYYELFRYLTLLMPLVLFLALFGWQGVAAAARRLGWPSGWRTPALALLVWSFAAPPTLFGLRDGYSGEPDDHMITVLRRALTRNNQLEVRYLLDAVARYPRCTFVTRSAVWLDERYEAMSFPYVVFAAPGRLPYAEVGGGPLLLEHVKGPAEQGAAPGAPECVLFYRSLDCNAVDADPCAGDLAGLEPLDERTFASRPFTHAEEYRHVAGTVRIGLYALPGAAP